MQPNEPIDEEKEKNPPPKHKRSDYFISEKKQTLLIANEGVDNILQYNR